MKAITFALACLAVALATMNADAARRFGGGSNLGKQRSVQEAPKAPAAAPAPTAPSNSAVPAKPATPAAAPAPMAKPSFMQRWGGLLAGLGIGALLAGLFGAQMGPMIGMLLAVLALGAVAFLLFRLFAGRRTPQPVERSPQFAAATPAPAAYDAPPASTGAGFSGIGSALPGGAAVAEATPVAPAAQAIDPSVLPPTEVDGFVRVAKTSFIRLQAANDTGDLDDIRDYTTPEMYAEIAMQLKDRANAPQRTEVVSVDARVIEAVNEGDYDIASVRFTGLIRENDARNPEPFDEIWHVRKNRRERNGSWMIAGIQQV